MLRFVVYALHASVCGAESRGHASGYMGVGFIEEFDMVDQVIIRFR